jgi:hypothetical protein
VLHAEGLDTHECLVPQYVVLDSVDSTSSYITATGDINFTTIHLSLIHIKNGITYEISCAKWQPLQYMADNVEMSLDGDVHKESRR